MIHYITDKQFSVDSSKQDIRLIRAPPKDIHEK